MRSIIGAIILGLLFIPVQADAHYRHHRHYHHHHSQSVNHISAPECDNSGHCIYQYAGEQQGGYQQPRHERRVHYAYRGSVETGEHYLSHPGGCPHSAFCGCGASVRIFGHPVRSLYLAANWLRFPRAAPAPGMAAARHGHVFVIEQVNGDGTVVASDYNSGGHMSRMHTVSLRGYVVVNPGG